MNIRPTSKGHWFEYQPEYQAGYQPLGSSTGRALRLIPSLILGLILDLILPSQLVLYIYTQAAKLNSKGEAVCQNKTASQKSAHVSESDTSLYK